MPHTASAKKRVRSTLRRTRVRRTRLSRVRTFIKKVEIAINSGSKTEAQAAFRLAQPELHRAVSKSVLHRRCVARKLSRLNARIKKLS